MIQNLCWVCPIYSTNNILSFNSLYSIKSEFIKEFVLMLPVLNEDNGQDFMNKYYCVGHTWTERKDGESSPLPRLIKIYLWTGMMTKSMRTMTQIINECLFTITLMNFLILI